ncbi:MAG TPA: 5-oxoprolinase subunit PxpB [Vicinamibacterales bacterium]|nr:5-oxoprolinase subunit PxpB [Vicinamibacterales bacterium]
MSTARIVRAGDSVLIIELEERIDPTVNARALAVADAVQARRLTGVLDVVPTFRSVAVYFDPLRTDYDALHALIEREAAEANPDASLAPTPLRIPVCYGGDLGPDLEAVAAFASLSPDDVVRLHSEGTYRVFMLGFVAGFAYMGIVDARIAVPRHSTPRVRVPAGSVAIAGVQTGIYPAETPGGWHVIGRTTVKPFDAARADPFLLKAGDAVQFYSIDRAEFDAAPSEASPEDGTASAR